MNTAGTRQAKEQELIMNQTTTPNETGAEAETMQENIDALQAEIQDITDILRTRPMFDISEEGKEARADALLYIAHAILHAQCIITQLLKADRQNSLSNAVRVLTESTVQLLIENSAANKALKKLQYEAATA